MSPPGRAGSVVRRPRVAIGAALVVPLMLLVAGCAAKATAPPAPFADCAAITASPPSASASASPPADLPDLRLPCFTGGQPVALRSLRGPAVINFWASYCGPCRAELPVMQRLADRAQGRLTVFGVDTGDRRDAGASFAAEHGVTMPTLFDENSKLHDALAGRALPMTVFVDAAGRRSVYVLPLDEKTLAEQVRAHAGVTVTW